MVEHVHVPLELFKLFLKTEIVGLIVDVFLDSEPLESMHLKVE